MDREAISEISLTAFASRSELHQGRCRIRPLAFAAPHVHV